MHFIIGAYTIALRQGKLTLSTMAVVTIDATDFRLEPGPWEFANQHRAEIEAHFAERQRETPSIWNGRVLLARDCVVTQRTMSANFFETDFASFIAWWDWDFPDLTVVNCFSMGAIRSVDGAFLLGVMAPHTARSGQIYFPAGIPDPDDVVDGKVDLWRSVEREIEEETGLASGHITPKPNWTAVLDGPKIALMRVLQADEVAVDLRERILQHIATDGASELANVRIVRSRVDLDQKMPSFVTAFLEHALAS
jgi:8-oxo-dGTP pyrophosphatase MutT (NUDIX family)